MSQLSASIDANAASAVQLVRLQCARPSPPEVDALVRALQARFGATVAAVLFYGSCRRGGDLREGVIDLYAVIDDRAAVESGWRAWLGARLPPNVYYLEADFCLEADFYLAADGASVDDRASHGSASQTAIGALRQRVRAKVGVFTRVELQRASRSFESYVWGRLAQPVSLVYARDAVVESEIIGVLARCVQTFLGNALPVAAAADPVEVWRIGLRHSYRTELRAESNARASDIIGDDGLYYEQLSLAFCPLAFVRSPDRCVGDGWAARPDASEARVRRRWQVRRIVGKFNSVLRLLKGLYTFDGGLDYLAWKLSRHSGQLIEIPERVRRWPLIFVWGLMLRLYRRGVFR